MSAGIRWTAAVIGLFVLTFPAAAQDEKAIKAAIQRGVTYLKARQTKEGFWRQSDPEANVANSGGDERLIGVTALVGLALLEGGVDPADPELVKASDLIRDAAPTLLKTY